MYKDIAIIGLGSIGGFLSSNIINIDTIKSLVLVDYDRVELENLKNSIYKKSDVGKFKVECVSSVIKLFNSEINITAIKDRYIEGKTKIPKCDLVIDCRDFVYDRGSEINMRLYISSRHLIIDCRKDIKYQLHYEGKYIDTLTKSDIYSATANLSRLIFNEELNDIIKNNLVHTIDMDECLKSSEETLNNYNNKMEVVMDYHKKNDCFINFLENAENIINFNKKSEVKICLNDKRFPLSTKIIPKNYIQNVNDLSKNFLSIIPAKNHSSYIVKSIIEKNICYVILIPETGAA